MLTVNANWEVLGQKLSYNFGRQWNKGQLQCPDPLNMLPGFEPLQTFRTGPKFPDNELRVSSTPDPDRPFDYDLGWYSKHSAATAARRSSICSSICPVHSAPRRASGSSQDARSAPIF